MTNEAKLKLVYKVAQLYYVENYMQKDIAEKLNINKVAISRMLAKAKKLKIVDIKIKSLSETFQDLELEIEKKYNLKECIVVSSFEKTKNTFIEIAKYLSEILNRIVKNNSSIGVSWGYSLGVISEHLDLEKKNNIKVIPIIGSLGVIEEGINSNIIARNLSEGFGGISYLINSPAVLENSQLKKAIEKDPNIKQIFELSKNLDVAIVGATNFDSGSSLYKFSSYNKKDFDYLTKMGVVGVVNLSSINNKGEIVHNDVDDRTIALPFDKLKNVDNVILVSVGIHKKDVIKAALKSGIIKIFMTDELTAKSVLNVK